MTNTIDTSSLHQIQYGIFIITSVTDTKINGQIATVAFQVTSKPAQIATCLNKNTLTHQFVMESKVFGISIITEEADLKFIGKFGFRSGRDIDKFIDTNYKKSITGSPLVLDHVSAIFDLKVNQIIDVGTHTLFIGEILASEKISEKKPITYDYYHKVVKGKTPQNAPTFQTT